MPGPSGTTRAIMLDANNMRSKWERPVRKIGCAGGRGREERTIGALPCHTGGGGVGRAGATKLGCPGGCDMIFDAIEGPLAKPPRRGG